MKILIVLPAYNEQQVLEQNTIKLYNYCQEDQNHPCTLSLDRLGAGSWKGGDTWQILIVDNDSFDKTQEIGRKLADTYSQIEYLRLDTKGKGLAIRKGWESREADVYVFMDADLSTDLSGLKPLIEAVAEQGYDIACGSRKLKESKIKRSLLRDLFSWGYSFLVRLVFSLKIKDLPCGFKAVNREVVEKVAPQIKSNAWFFDSELVILASQQGYKVKEIPVKWQEAERESRLEVVSLSWEYLRNVVGLKRRLSHKSTKYHKI